MPIDPRHDSLAKLKYSVRLVYFTASLYVIFGMTIVSGVLESLQKETAWPWFILGAVIGVAGYLTEAYRSKAALAVAVGLFTLDGVLTIWAALEAGGFPPIWPICFRIALIMLMGSGFISIDKLNASN